MTKMPFLGPVIYVRVWKASNGSGRWGIGVADAHGLMGMGRVWTEPIWGWGRGSTVEDEELGGTATRSHEGHMVSVVGGVICM